MINILKSFSEARFDQRGMMILWSEAGLFSIVFGIAYRSGLVSVILFSILFMLLRSPQRVIYAVFVLSFLWGMIFAALGYDGGGWIWALALGGFVFYKGVRIHFRELTLSWNDQIYTTKNAVTGRGNWYLGGQNLN